MSLQTSEKGALPYAMVAAVLLWTGTALAEPAADADADADRPAAEADASSQRRIDVWEYRVSGNTVLEAAEIEAAVSPFLGPQRTIADVDLAREALEQAYRQRGYETVGVEIPEQDVRNGVIRFTVRELRVGRLRVTGARYYSPAHVKAGIPSLAEGAVPRYDHVSRDIGAINQSRDRTITPTLRAGLAPNTVDVDLEVEDTLPVHGSVEINDRYSTRTSRLRAVGSVSYSNLFQRDHNLSVQMQLTPEALEESLVISASYLAPFPRRGFSLVVYGVHSESDVAAVSGIDVLGSGDIVGVRGVWNFPGDQVVHTVLVGADYKDFQEDLVLGADTAATPISYLPLTLEYTLNRFGDGSTTEFSAALNAGTRGLFSDDQEFGLKRFGAKANYLFTRLNLSRTQALPAGTRLIVELAGQASSEPLISNEGFGIGGVDSVRGYQESQDVGDAGLRASLQLESPSLIGANSRWVQALRLFGFGDWATVQIKDPLADIVTGETVDRITLYSAGAGISVNALQHLDAMVAVAAPLKDEDALDLDIGDDYRIHFRLKAEF